MKFFISSLLLNDDGLTLSIEHFGNSVSHIPSSPSFGIVPSESHNERSSVFVLLSGFSGEISANNLL